ncbi:MULTISPECIES: DUF930 domain-containing protein [Rhizobium]|uniref:DUF930 domain-containing protein n=1 Tax=Rhizobium changzhiense TaxID=2692317 RepID=A0A7Z0RJT9_9HYPH|nr:MULTISPECIES: DUF930 domain-containing protein [Rhizobium]NKK72359.1 DUF930 domain-containing protein [Rhizobium leguminosarum bv. viciae]MBA5801766.1 DUF930 domain-containing protein [Rhizobium changzhiense]MCV9941748.1 DUF930 domain-containing protein [Rhizobium sp. BT-175]MCW0016298.1 DUF930 domain-containing protein [Rhizobium sp. BT-226]NKL32961.1 DUF930 domain-containing protein [Rhizobium leguminosarum bv. viciae]
MELAADKWDDGIRRGAAASFALHIVAILLLLLLLPKAEPPLPLPDDGLSVEIVPQAAEQLKMPEPAKTPSPEQAKPEAAKPEAEPAVPVTNNPPAAVMPSVAPITLPVQKPAEFVKARQLFSDKLLADPRSRRAREALRGLAGSERNLQLCDLEALEQVRRAHPAMAPDMLAPYAMVAEKVSGNSVEVRGGAFRSKRKWYNIQFKCELDAGSGKVASFAFLVGDAIPQGEWQEHNLVADDGAVDQ